MCDNVFLPQLGTCTRVVGVRVDFKSQGSRKEHVHTSIEAQWTCCCGYALCLSIERLLLSYSVLLIILLHHESNFPRALLTVTEDFCLLPDRKEREREIALRQRAIRI